MSEIRVLTPADVMALLGCGVRQAFRFMREAGALKVGESLRIEEEQFKRWLQRNEDSRAKSARVGITSQAHRDLVAPDLPSPPTDLPRIRPTQPRWPAGKPRRPSSK
jgi:hypothetical protein